MAGAFFFQQRDAVAAGMARELGCDSVAFEGDALTICTRPESAVWPFIAMLCTFGTGTALSIDPNYRDWAEANLPARHYRSLTPDFLFPLVAEGQRRGIVLEAQAANLCFALGQRPVPPTDVPGFAFEREDPAWMTAQRASGIFHNALGRTNEAYRSNQDRFAILAYDSAGDLAAVAGVFNTTGLFEIGVDVARGYRGHGLANAVVARATAAILEVHETPYYSCGATNIRSQRTALANGYLPVCSIGYVAPKIP